MTSQAAAVPEQQELPAPIRMPRASRRNLAPSRITSISRKERIWAQINRITITAVPSNHSRTNQIIRRETRLVQALKKAGRVATGRRITRNTSPKVPKTERTTMKEAVRARREEDTVVSTTSRRVKSRTTTRGTSHIKSIAIEITICTIMTESREVDTTNSRIKIRGWAACQ